MIALTSKRCGTFFGLLCVGLCFMAAPCNAVPCGPESRNCDPLAYCENITVDGVWEPTCICPEGTIGSDDHRDNHPPFTSGICNKDLWTVRYVKDHTIWGEWRTCGGARTNGDGGHGRYHCNECLGEVRYGRDDPARLGDAYDGPWWTTYSGDASSLSACSASNFGVSQADDPYDGIAFKACDCRELVQLPSDKWTKCAEEHGRCTCDGLIRYGSDGAERGHADYLTAQGGETIPCTNTFFGDPDPGQYKACYCFDDVREYTWENPDIISKDKGYAMCEAGAGGYHFRKLGDTIEVNCLYDNKTLAELEQPSYDDPSYHSEARVYRWVLPTTAEPLEIPPTGMTVESVTFDSTCAESGCWVINGILTTGEAFNDFSVFNTFFLPQAVGDDSLSHDFDYSATGSNVDWTFQPANNPCTSVNYMAGIDDIFHISYCCIDEPAVGPTGGLVANYRPTQNFVNWVGEKDDRCDLQITNAEGRTKCWKAMGDGTQKDTWDQADARCRVAGGVLPSVLNQEENDALRALADAKFGRRAIWVGIRDRQEEGMWEWSDGSDGPGNALDESNPYYMNWKGRSEPNDSPYGYFGEDCVEMRTDGLWNDQSCAQGSSILNYFCQFENEEVCSRNIISRPGYAAPDPQTNSAPCWDVPSEALPYVDAAAFCAARNGTLAKVDTPEKFHLMKRVLDRDNHNLQNAWIGLDDMATEGEFTWIGSSDVLPDSPPFPFMGWKTSSTKHEPAYPLSWMEVGESTDCVKVTDLGRWWVDADCSEAIRFVCELPREEGVTCSSDLPNLDPLWTVPFPVNYDSFMVGPFKGMDVSPGVVDFTNLDPYFGQFSFEVRLDEVELRQKAGQLRGTVGVEHTVDTFLGLSNFRPTGLANGIIDTFATQTALHLEKTSFFTVSTHGTNQYTFLEYVNMRLVAVYAKDDDFSGAGESGLSTVRTDSSNQANYVQVTFTLGSQYNVDPAGSPLIPSDSVRAGHGTFFDTAAMSHKCEEYAPSIASAGAPAFSSLLEQDCAPAAAMCASPSSIADSFVAFNIPLGIDYFAAAGGPSSTLENNIFVQMVVSATEVRQDTAPNDGGEPMQMKTTLTGSIPIVEGGINIFCDGFTAKTDLEDVADADIVVGSASSAEELSRLRIMENIASTQLNPNEITQIDSDSIEAGLMTLVLKGDASYFDLGGRSAVSIELEDVITIHIMESDGSGEGTSKDDFVKAKLLEAPDDNSDSAGLDVDGYCLNGAFCFEIDRSAQRAHLEPTAALLAECPFNPSRPANSVLLETCVTRRDVRYRDFPWRVGAMSTAMEICVGGSCPADGTQDSDESSFLTTILGNSDYAKDLAVDYANVIDGKYGLNGVYRRAYWINPGYEWTPTQTGGTPIFSVSQKLYLFALITLDEGLTGDDGNTIPGGPNAGPFLPNDERRRMPRRMLLQSSPSTTDEALQDGQSEVGGGVFEFQTTPTRMLAKAFDVPQDLVATFSVKLQLTQAEACMADTDLQTSIRDTLEEYVSESTSPWHTVQVTTMLVDKQDVQCTRRSVRALQSAYSSATAQVTMMVVFKEGSEPTISLARIFQSPGVEAIQPLAVSETINMDADATFTPSPEASSSSTGSANLALIAGAAAGGAALVVAVAILAVLCLRRRQVQTAVTVVEPVSVRNLKQRLSEDDGDHGNQAMQTTVQCEVVSAQGSPVAGIKPASAVSSPMGGNDRRRLLSGVSAMSSDDGRSQASASDLAEQGVQRELPMATPRAMARKGEAPPPRHGSVDP